MKKKAGFLYWVFWIMTFTLSLSLSPSPARANLGGEPKKKCCPRSPVEGGSAISLTEGNSTDQYQVSSLKSAFGTTIDFFLTYASYIADNSQGGVETGLGFGWTHSYNIFLFSQGLDMFRMDGDGRTTKFQRGPGGIFTSTPGYFEILVQNPDGTFTLRQKNGTVFTFAQVPDTEFPVGGPVHRLTRIVDRNNNTTTLSYSNGSLTTITDTYGRSLTLTYSYLRNLDILYQCNAFRMYSTAG